MPVLTTQKGEITIRLATIEDAASLIKLRLESLSMHPTALAADIDLTVAGGVKAWQELISGYGNAKSGVIILACNGDELIGMAAINRGHWPKTRHGGTLWGVYVKPDWRGLHIGVGLVDGCINWAIENQMTVLYLQVTDSEQAAIGCYTHCGFTKYGIEPRVIFYDGRYYDQVLMVRLIDQPSLDARRH